MFCINICFWSRSRSEPSFYGWSWSRYFLPGAGAEIKISGAGAEENWFGSATLALPSFTLTLSVWPLSFMSLAQVRGSQTRSTFSVDPLTITVPANRHTDLTQLTKNTQIIIIFFFASGVGSPLCPWVLHYYTMILQRIRIIVGDAGFESGTSAPEAWYRYASNEPPHLQIIIMY